VCAVMLSESETVATAVAATCATGTATGLMVPWLVPGGLIQDDPGPHMQAHPKSTKHLHRLGVAGVLSTRMYVLF
jgi:hypothetical protein